MNSEPLLQDEPALIVDLDGTLLSSDWYLEAGLACVRTHPTRLLHPSIWRHANQARLKETLARTTHLDVAHLPYRREIIAFLKAEHRKGRRIILATTSHRLLAERIAEHLRFFDEVIATDSDHNLTAESKKSTILQRFGECGFDYVGTSSEDSPIWRTARHAYGVAQRGSKHEGQSRHFVDLAATFGAERPTARDWLKALRLHQWAKNLLILAPLVAAHRMDDTMLVAQGLLAFLLFGLCASSVYLLNDLLDLGDDRHHATKRHRPFAAGRLSIRSGLIAIPALLLTAFAGALWLLPYEFAAVLAAYYSLTLAYSLALKRRMVIDVIALASLYTLRIIAGSAALLIPLSFWMLAFSMFMFLSLALVKRYAELHQARRGGKTEKARGRGYYPSDLEMLASLGGSSGRALKVT
ncbi:UbiA family prenyltransferase [Imhoffiella purpurea]|uniref:Integral membrane protein n=1 Tax=Imhoffiella purpurea TaxID=1249627 RepID=W9VBM3_9GAMM|nr:UbiA family prenyltransferase [Imhoffiella purpurea]EXJ13442.1 integral membrane protein [Imhoffiella purpurea]